MNPMGKQDKEKAALQVIEMPPSSNLVRTNGLEPSRVAPLPPQGCLSNAKSLNPLARPDAPLRVRSRSDNVIRNRTATKQIFDDLGNAQDPDAYRGSRFDPDAPCCADGGA
jgi:hypothetical protein